ncbi:hypothetical protein DFH07DRAFT_898792 [Mycena maculata]|uniref:Uncharacterized protein n=1 Tax=Mycena maculata TaxID=230809 RepID=A0AAD7HFP0_9AGAR|nr:hypothetical protein DFH07DRAFT_898792 [Mycena maculata]
MAPHIPDEIVSEIVSPLLKYSDEVFSDTSEKPLLSQYSSSTYLLVCKSWLRVSTPLLYNVVILRTTAQAKALGEVLKSNREFGPFIRKLRVEGGFGSVMHAILKCAPNITDLFLTLSVWGSDDVGGLCTGLKFVNPRRVIVVDGGKKNKQVARLFETLINIIPKWDKLITFVLPVSDERAEALASALTKSKSLRTLVVRTGDFPRYLYQMGDIPSLETIRLTFWGPGEAIWLQHMWLRDIREEVDADPKMKALVTYDFGSNKLHDISIDSDEDTSSNPSSASERNDVASDIQTLESLGKTSGHTMQKLRFSLPEPQGRGSKSRLPTANPSVLLLFAALTHLTWSSPALFSFSAPPAGFSALPNLETLCLLDCSSSVLGVFTQLALDYLRDVSLDKPVDVPGATPFLQRHGAKLVTLSAPLEILAKAKVFDVCTSLSNLEVVAPYTKVSPERRALPDNFISCSTPHTSLTKIYFKLWAPLERQHKSAIKKVFGTLDPTSFPELKEIQLQSANWPTSEKEIPKNEAVIFSELLRPKGIKLTDQHGLAWSGRSGR